MNNDINEHDIIESTEELPNIPKGTSGIIIHVYDKGAAYEVEFQTPDRAIEIVEPHQIRKV